jgi:hypothetical protein
MNWDREAPDDLDLRLVRPFSLTGGRTRSSSDLPIETLLVSTRVDRDMPSFVPERRMILDLCARPTSVAEVSAILKVPLGVARVLAGDLVTEGLVTAYRPQPAEEGSDLHLLERVLNGLHSL